MPLVHLVSENAEAVEAARLYRIGAGEKKASQSLGFDPENLSIEEIVFIARRQGAESAGSQQAEIRLNAAREAIESARPRFQALEAQIVSAARREGAEETRRQFEARQAEIVSAARREGAEETRRQFEARDEERRRIQELKLQESTKKRLETRARNIREKEEAKERIESEIREIANSAYAPFVFCGLGETSSAIDAPASEIEVTLDDDGDGGSDAGGKKQRVN
jgi:TolA-binding protein